MEDEEVGMNWRRGCALLSVAEGEEEGSPLELMLPLPQQQQLEEKHVVRTRRCVEELCGLEQRHRTLQETHRMLIDEHAHMQLQLRLLQHENAQLRASGGLAEVLRQSGAFADE